MSETILGEITINNAPIGWMCPKCGRVHSPNMPVCCYCNNNMMYKNKYYNNISIHYSNTPIDEEKLRECRKQKNNG